MSKLSIGDKSGRISDVHFVYVRIQSPTKKYQSEETEYTVGVVVDEDTADAMKEKFKKNGVKEVKTAEFEDKYKFAPPYPSEKKQYILNFKTNSHMLDKDTNKLVPKPYEWNIRPKVYVPDGDKVKDVTRDLLVGNGSFGDVAFNISDTSFGVIHNLAGILVKDLIERDPPANTTPFGEVVESNHHEEDDNVPF
jgi:hypothetical protein